MRAYSRKHISTSSSLPNSFSNIGGMVVPLFEPVATDWGNCLSLLMLMHSAVVTWSTVRWGSSSEGPSPSSSVMTGLEFAILKSSSPYMSAVISERNSPQLPFLRMIRTWYSVSLRQNTLDIFLSAPSVRNDRKSSPIQHSKRCIFSEGSCHLFFPPRYNDIPGSPALLCMFKKFKCYCYSYAILTTSLVYREVIY